MNDQRLRNSVSLLISPTMVLTFFYISGMGQIPKNRLYYREVNSSGPFTHLLDETDASYNLIGNTGSDFLY